MMTALLTGHIGVSGVLASAATSTPVIAVAVPFETTSGRRVLSGAFHPGTGSLGTYFDTVIPIGGRTYLVDALGNIVVAGETAEEHLARTASAAARHSHPYGVLMIDIDRFKNVNDTYGHQAGDDVLGLVARTLRGVARVEDVVSRWGGEEFLVVIRSRTPDLDRPCSGRHTTVTDRDVGDLGRQHSIRIVKLRFGFRRADEMRAEPLSAVAHGITATDGGLLDGDPSGFSHRLDRFHDSPGRVGTSERG
jgi:GGDEF domain-containing protein